MFGVSGRGTAITTLYTPRPGVEYDLRDAVLDATQPLATFIAYGGGVLDVTQPAATFSADGYIARGVLDVVQPTATFIAYGGGTLNVTQPAATFTATGEASIVGVLSVTQAAATFAGTGDTGCIGTITATQPAATFSAYGGGELTCTQTAATFTATGVIGTVGELSVIQPAATFSASADVTQCIGTLSVTQGAMYAMYGDLYGVQPTPTFEASGTVGTALENLISYVMNIKTAETTTYSNYAFKFIFRAGFEYYGVGNDDKLYQLTGATDAGTAIDARFKTAQNDMKTSNLKRVPYCYADSDEPVNITPYADSVNSGTFLSHASGRRTHLARGPKGKFWQFEVSNVSGNEMKVGSLEALPEVLSRKI